MEIDADKLPQPAIRALADLCGAIAAEVDLDACGVRLGKAMEAAQVALGFHAQSVVPEDSRRRERTRQESETFMTTVADATTERAGITPGPWQMHDPDYCPEEIWGALDMEDGKVRGVLVCEVNQEAEGWEANARLVSSSPDLLEVCKRFVQSREYELPGNSDFVWIPISAETIRLMYAAIAKATGN